MHADSEGCRRVENFCVVDSGMAWRDLRRLSEGRLEKFALTIPVREPNYTRPRLPKLSQRRRFDIYHFYNPF
jgi:hypothetical protein